MLIDEIKNIKSTKSDLRKFGLAVGIVFGLLGGLFLWKEKEFYSYFLIISAILILFGALYPSLLRPIQKIWMTFAVVMGWFMTRLILCILFYLMVTPIGFLARLSGKVFLDRKFHTGADSYWIQKTRKTADKTIYEKQF